MMLQNRSGFATLVLAEGQDFHYLTRKWQDEKNENFYSERDSRQK